MLAAAMHPLSLEVEHDPLRRMSGLTQCMGLSCLIHSESSGCSHPNVIALEQAANDLLSAAIRSGGDEFRTHARTRRTRRIGNRRGGRENAAGSEQGP